MNWDVSPASERKAAPSGAHKTRNNEPIADGQGFTVDCEAIPGASEDSRTAETDALGGFLCVADGCGGIGARRYAQLGHRSEAHLAAKLTAECVKRWAEPFSGNALPTDAQAAQKHVHRLRDELIEHLGALRAQHGEQAESRILVSRVRRPLPTTLCAALIDARDAQALSAMFCWAGDSRGYVLTPAGLRQCTADHLYGSPDPMENLYRDARLGNLVSADGNFTLDTFGLTLPKPCIVLTATDGAFGYLPTPMEFELLLLATLRRSVSLQSWQKRLGGAIRRVTGDDATLTLACYGVKTFAQLQTLFTPRCARLQAAFVTPVRRRAQNPAFARTLWEEYRKDYLLCEEGRHADWRL